MANGSSHVVGCNLLYDLFSHFHFSRITMHMVGMALFLLLPVFSSFAAIPGEETSPVHVRVGVYINPPMVFKDAAGNHAGIFPDILRAIAEKEGWVVEFIPGTREQCLRRLEEGRLDVMVDAELSSEQTQEFLFSNEVVLVDWGVLYSRKGLIIHSILDLRDKKVAVVRGSPHTIRPKGIKELLEKFEIPCTFVETQDSRQVLRLLDEGRADVGVVSRLFGFINENGHAVERTPVIFNPRPLRFMFPKHSEKSKSLLRSIDYQLTLLKRQENSIYHQKTGAYLSGLPNPWHIAQTVPLTDTRYSKKEKEWISKHPVIRIGHDPAFHPFEFSTEDGRFQGVAADYLALIATRLGVAFSPEPGLSWNQALDKAMKKEIDVLPCIGVTEERKKHFLFSKPYLSFPRVIITRSNLNIHSMEELTDKKVGVQERSSHHGFLKEKTDHDPILYKTFKEALIALSRGEIEAVIGNLAVAKHVIRKLSLANLHITAYAADNPFPLALAVRNDWPELRQLINKAIASITPEEHNAIHERWLEVKVRDLEANKLRRLLTPEEISWLTTHPNIRVGVDPAYPPYSFCDEKNAYHGLAVDYLKILSQRMNIHFDIVPALSWPQLLEGAKERSLDVIATAVKTPEREKYLMFTEEYLPTPLVIMTHEDRDDIHNPEDLIGKRVALVKGYSSTDRVVSEHPDIIPLYMDQPLQGLIAVATGRAEAYIGVLGINHYLCSRNGISNLQVAGNYDTKTTGQRLAVRSDFPILASILDKALTTVSEPQKIELFHKWIPTSRKAVHDTKFELSTREKEWLRAHPVIKVASDPSWAPLEFAGKNGDYQGLSIDYLKALEKRLNIRFAPQKDLNWQQLVGRVRAFQVDMFSCVTKTPERMQFLSFTRPYLSIPVAIFARSDIPYIGSLSELNRKKVVVVEGYAVEEWLSKDYPEIELIRAGTIEKAMEMLFKGQVFAFVGNLLTGTYYLGKMKHPDIKVAGKTEYSYAEAMAVRSDWPVFTRILQKALDSLPEAECNSIYKKWISVRYEHGFDYSLLWKISLPLFILVLLFSYWNRRLHKEIKQRKRAETLRDNLVHMLVHDMRNPLASVIGSLELIRFDLREHPQPGGNKTIDSSILAASKLTEMIDCVLDVSRMESDRMALNRTPCSVLGIAQEVIKTMSPLMEKEKITVNINDYDSMVICDRELISRVMGNLIGNAVKFTPKGGSVAIEISRTEPYTWVNVRDTGPGIPKQYHEEIFDKFKTLETEGKIGRRSSGLGLAFCKLAVVAHGGEIGIDSLQEQGSTFWFSLPNIDEQKGFRANPQPENV